MTLSVSTTHGHRKRWSIRNARAPRLQPAFQQACRDVWLGGYRPGFGCSATDSCTAIAPGLLVMQVTTATRPAGLLSRYGLGVSVLRPLDVRKHPPRSALEERRVVRSIHVRRLAVRPTHHSPDRRHPAPPLVHRLQPGKASRQAHPETPSPPQSQPRRRPSSAHPTHSSLVAASWPGFSRHWQHPAPCA